jgi:hypothetical protein
MRFEVRLEVVRKCAGGERAHGKLKYKMTPVHGFIPVHSQRLKTCQGSQLCTIVVMEEAVIKTYGEDDKKIGRSHRIV